MSQASFKLDADEWVAIRVRASLDAIAYGFCQPCGLFGDGGGRATAAFAVVYNLNSVAGSCISVKIVGLWPTGFRLQCWRITGLVCAYRFGRANVGVFLVVNLFALPCKAVAIHRRIVLLPFLQFLESAFELLANEWVAVWVLAAVHHIDGCFAEPCTDFGVVHRQNFRNHFCHS